jgi:peptide/nickel transport system substrate-binding protein
VSLSLKNLSTFLGVFFCLHSYASSQAKLDVGVLGDITLSHPLLISKESDSLLTSFTLLPIVSLEKGWKWECRLCTELPTQANKGLEIFTDKTGIQKLSIHIKLPNSLSWGDGTPLLLKDVSFTWKVLQNLETSYPLSPLLQEIEDIIVHPEPTRHFTILLKKVSHPYPILNAFYILSEHIEAKRLSQKNDEAKDSSYLQDPFNPGLYNGPFIWMSHNSKESTFFLKRNPNSPLLAKIEGVDLHAFAQLKDVRQALESGILDIALGIQAWGDAFAFLQSLQSKKEKFQTVSSDSYFYEHLDFNLQNPIFQDVYVRRALAYAIDKNTLLSTATHNQAIPSVSPIHPGDPYFSSEISFYEHSLVKAKKLLAKSDWQIGNDGYFTKKNRILSFEILTTDDPVHIKIANALVKTWKDLGAQVTVRAVSLGEFREKLAKRHFSGLLLYAWKLPLFQSTKPLYNSTAIPSLSNGYSGQNISAWINIRVDDALSKFANTINENERRHHLQFFQQEYTRELPGIPLFFRTEAHVFLKTLHNFSVGPSLTGIGLTAAKWEL